MAMKKITFSADAALLELAEQIAKEEGTTLEEEVRQWLHDFGAGRWKLPPREPKQKSNKARKDSMHGKP
jgi:transposase